jgi:hypothetical protein
MAPGIGPLPACPYSSPSFGWITCVSQLLHHSLQLSLNPTCTFVTLRLEALRMGLRARAGFGSPPVVALIAPGGCGLRIVEVRFVAPRRLRKKAETLECSVKTESKAVETCCASGTLNSSTILRSPTAQDTKNAARPFPQAHEKRCKRLYSNAFGVQLGPCAKPRILRIREQAHPNCGS